MGEFLRTSLIVKMSIHKGNLKEIKEKDSAICPSKIIPDVVDNPESFVFEEEENHYSWHLKPAVLEEHLLTFLKSYYKGFYNSATYKEKCLPVLDLLKNRPKDVTLHKYLEDNNNNYTISVIDSSYYTNVFNERSTIYTDEIELTCEGKVMYEEIFDHIEFFMKSIRKTYSHSPLGGSLAINIS